MQKDPKFDKWLGSIVTPTEFDAKVMVCRLYLAIKRASDIATVISHLVDAHNGLCKLRQQCDAGMFDQETFDSICRDISAKARPLVAQMKQAIDHEVSREDSELTLPDAAILMRFLDRTVFNATN